MYVIELIYKVPLAEIDANMTAHVVFLKKYLRRRQFPGVGSKDST